MERTLGSFSRDATSLARPLSAKPYPSMPSPVYGDINLAAHRLAGRKRTYEQAFGTSVAHVDDATFSRQHVASSSTSSRIVPVMESTIFTQQPKNASQAKWDETSVTCRGCHQLKVGCICYAVVQANSDERDLGFEQLIDLRLTNWQGSFRSFSTGQTEFVSGGYSVLERDRMLNDDQQEVTEGHRGLIRPGSG